MSSASSMNTDSKASGGSANQSGAAKAKGKAAEVTLEMLEEDDEFEDFEGMTWEDVNDKGAKSSSTQLWKDNWDDDVHDEFMDQLREVVKKQEVNTKAVASMDTSDSTGAAAGGKSK